MPSPFPGMNPYLEQPDAWPDFHQNFIVRAQESLHTQVLGRYIVKVEMRLYRRETPADDLKSFAVADVGLAGRRPPAADAAAPADGSVTAPVLAEIPFRAPDRHTWLEIHDRH